MPDRAQTETLGFVLVFALITASIGLVYASGFTGLDEAREFEQVNNAERAFEVFADNIDDMVQWNAPSRATEIRLSDSTLTIDEPIVLHVNATGGGLDETYDVRPVVYDADVGDRVIYAQGAIMRESSGGAIVVRESSMLITEDRTMIPIIQTRLSGTGSVGGSRTVLIRASRTTSSVRYTDENPTSTIWFNVTSPRADAWADHLESKSGVTSCTVDGGVAACELDTDRIAVSRVQIELAIE